MNKIEMRPIGYVRSPIKDRSMAPIQPEGGKDIRGTIEIMPEFVEGLRDLEGFSRIQVIFHLHESEDYSLTVIPFLDDRERGVFSTRAPRRPNPIGLSSVILERIQGNKMHIRGMDMIDGTPVLDIKPYVPRIDSHPDERIGWIEDRDQGMENSRSDGRFGPEND